MGQNRAEPFRPRHRDGYSLHAGEEIRKNPGPAGHPRGPGLRINISSGDDYKKSPRHCKKGVLIKFGPARIRLRTILRRTRASPSEGRTPFSMARFLARPIHICIERCVANLELRVMTKV